jgi:succinylarginine dihydrolase
VTLPSGKLCIIAPVESRENERARQFLERVLTEEPLVEGVKYLNVNGSMKNGGGPACLRLRVGLTERESARLGARVVFEPALEATLREIIEHRYRDRLELADVADPAFVEEARVALDELTSALDLGSVYDFQR